MRLSSMMIPILAVLALLLYFGTFNYLPVSEPLIDFLTVSSQIGIGLLFWVILFEWIFSNKSNDNLERDYIRNTLRYTHGDVVQASEILDIDQTLLQNKIKKYGLKN